MADPNNADESRHTEDDDGDTFGQSSEYVQLLQAELPESPAETKKWHFEQGQDEAESKLFCCVDRWWKLALFLFFWALLIPFAVNWIDKGSYTASADEEAPLEHTLASNDYVLDPNWDYDATTQVRAYSWTVSETEHNPDGVYRPMLLINNQFPGPMIEVNEFDTIRVTVKNNATNATSVHWHGLYQNGTNHMDGTVGVTQCPIAPGSSFTYEFKVERQSGTYWYHGHQGVQASDGLVGPLIIHAKREKTMQKIQYATDRVVMVSDHYHDLSGALTRQYLAPDRENAEPVPDGALINGKAVRDCDSLSHRRCDNSTANVGTPIFTLSPNEHHRLRIINVGAFAEFQFQVDEHEFAVTEVDGTDVWPEYYHRLNINPAQRYSIIISTNVTTSDLFRIRARMITTCFAEPNPHMAGEVHAVLRYGNTEISADLLPSPTSKDWGEALWLECRDLNTTDLRPVEEIAAPAEADAFFFLRSNFEIGAYRLSRGFFNGSSFRPNVLSPTLIRAIDGLQTDNQTFSNRSLSRFEDNTDTAFVNNAAFDTAKELVIQTKGVQTVDVLIRNFDDGNHPIHLHGYKFFVLAQGHGAPEHTDQFRGMDRANLEPLYSSLDLSNPLRRDTASVEAYGWILIRFIADNPGCWAFHCHVSWHAEAGLLMQFLTRMDLLQDMKLPDSHTALCAAEGLERGTAPKDEDYYQEATGT